MSDLVLWLVFFVLLCLVVAVVCAAIRERDARVIVREATHFFVMMLIGILIFSAIVYVLEWAFNRRL